MTKKLLMAICASICAASASAGQFINYSNVSVAPPGQVSEPVTITQNLGAAYYVAAYIVTTGSGPSSKARLWTAWTTDPTQPWGNQQQMPLLGNLDQSGDPLLLANPAGGGVYLIGTSRNLTQCDGNNQISLWSARSAGQPWTNGPLAIHANAAGSSYFDDKPAALLAKFGYRAGVVFVAFIRMVMTPGPNNSCSSSQQSILFYSYDPGTGVVTPLASPASGTNITNPIISEDANSGALYVTYQDFATSNIVIKVSYNGGSTWNDLASISAPNMLVGDPDVSKVCSNAPRAPQCVSAAIGQTSAVNPLTGFMYVTWAHRVTTDNPDVHDAEVLYSMGTPGRSMSAPTPVLADPNLSFFSCSTHAHSTFTPAIDFDSSGNAFITYYDYDHGCSPGELSYTLRGTKIRPYPPPYDGRTDTLFTAFDSHPATTGVTAHIGEYQGVFFNNGVFDAVSVMYLNGTANIYHLQAVP